MTQSASLEKVVPEDGRHFGEILDVNIGGSDKEAEGLGGSKVHGLVYVLRLGL